MGYYTRYSMEIQDIDNKGYDSYKNRKVYVRQTGRV